MRWWRAARLRKSWCTTTAHNVKATNTGSKQNLASTQDHFGVPGNPFKELTFAQMSASAAGSKEREIGLGTRPLFRSATAATYEKDGGKFTREGDIPANLVTLGTPKNRPSKPIQPHSLQDTVRASLSRGKANAA